jgi:hypothetical protein
LVLVLVLVLVLEPPTDLSGAPPAARIDLHAGAGWRDDTVTRPLSDATATGSAFSDLGLRLAVFPSTHVGLAASLRAGRFTMTPARGVTSPDHVDQRSTDVAGAIVARAFLARLTLEGQVGYGYLRLPAAVVVAGPAGDVRYTGGSVRGHGLYTGASLRLALGRFGLEVAGEGRPVLWGADYAGTSVQPRWFAARGGATVDCCTLGRSRWSLLAGYELAQARASGEGTRLTQKQRLFGLGLRATWLPPSRAPPPPPAPPSPSPRPAPPPPGAISGVVHGLGNQPVPAFVTLTELGLAVHADPQGAFRFDVPAGQYTLTVEAEGYLPQNKVITVRPGEQHIYNLELQPVAP